MPRVPVQGAHLREERSDQRAAGEAGAAPSEDCIRSVPDRCGQRIIIFQIAYKGDNENGKDYS